MNRMIDADRLIESLEKAKQMHLCSSGERETEKPDD